MGAQSGKVEEPESGASPFSWAAATHSGLRRPSNEDSYCARPDLSLFVVADGMGGHVAGEVASQLTVKTLEAFIEHTAALTKDDAWPFPFEPDLSVQANRLKAGIRMANRRLADEQAHESALKGMATTASAVLLGRGPAAIAHVGDSRVYLLRGGVLQRLTADHSWVEEQVRAGTMTPSAARQHPWRNVVTRALSGGHEPEVDTREQELRPLDRLLICSDGLSGVVPDATIGDLLGQGKALDEVSDSLVDEANRAGGPDNVTVLVLAIDAP